MQRKPGFPVANCSIKMPDPTPAPTTSVGEPEEEGERRQQLINFGHSQWGFNNWSWSVTKQELDFVDFANGKYCAGVVAFVSITVKTCDIHRENIGYATTFAATKGSAIHQSRKCAVTNALRETLLSFGGNVATELAELLESHKTTLTTNTVPEQSENNQNLLNKPPVPEPKNVLPLRKESIETVRPHPLPPAIKNAVPNPPVAKAMPMPANLPPAANRAPLPANAPRPHTRPNSNVSFVLQPVMGGVVPPVYPPRLAPPQMPPVYPPYYEYAGPWHFAYESFDRHHGNVNLNFNMPPKNLVVNGRAGSECKNACGVRQGPGGPEGEPIQYGAQNQGCWIKPTIFYDGFWTEQKVKKWVAEQVEKQFPEDASQKSASPSNGQDPAASKS